MDSSRRDVYTKRGWLMKKGGLMKTTWQHRYFVLSGNFLIYYIKEDDIKSQGSILLDQHRILEQPISPDEPDHFIFEIVSGEISSFYLDFSYHLLVCELIGFLSVNSGFVGFTFCENGPPSFKKNESQQLYASKLNPVG